MVSQFFPLILIFTGKRNLPERLFYSTQHSSSELLFLYVSFTNLCVFWSEKYFVDVINIAPLTRKRSFNYRIQNLENALRRCGTTPKFNFSLTFINKRINIYLPLRKWHNVQDHIKVQIARLNLTQELQNRQVCWAEDKERVDCVIASLIERIVERSLHNSSLLVTHISKKEERKTGELMA